MYGQTQIVTLGIATSSKHGTPHAGEPLVVGLIDFVAEHSRLTPQTLFGQFRQFNVSISESQYLR